MLIGAHVSIAGGIDLAPARGAEIGCTAIQIFLKNQRQWHTKYLTDDEIKRYLHSLSNSPVKSVLAHSSYLINLGSPEKNQLQKSLDSFILELNRCEKLKIENYIFHPGAHKKSGEQAGIQRIAESINFILNQCPEVSTNLLLETTAGQGTSVGYRFEQLSQIIESINKRDKLGVCLDTAHVFAAGYDLSVESGYEQMMTEFDQSIGLERLKVFHLNDSKTRLGSRIDRHEQIGKGKIGLCAFNKIMNDTRIINVPKIIETPGDTKSDAQYIELLKQMAGI